MLSGTISERLQAKSDALTRAERQLADAIMENYPVSGLGSITSVAHKAGVSTPTVARLVQKLGFKGFPGFQKQLRKELEAKISGPIAKYDKWAGDAPDTHILNRFTDAVMKNIKKSLAQIDPATFDATCKLLADEQRTIYVVGGRITRALADYFFLHMQVIRPNVTHIQSISNAWPHYLLNVKKGDVIVIFDVRRYENSTLKLAEMAANKGATIILMTDQWISPISQFTDLVFSSRIVVPSAWDSSVASLLLLETILAEVQELIWPHTRSRMQELEDMFDKTKFFRKFT
ncbi:MAG: MurR/RpiR family transcriptional regulator [Amylibacter sp.]|nr:MurR/RpiR family transcriptional regulator [Amylibacter sp.]